MKTSKNTKPVAKSESVRPKSVKPKSARTDVAVAHVLTEDEAREAVMKPVNQWRSYIRRLLNESGTYDRKYGYQVTLTAQSLRLLQSCYFELMSQNGDSRFTVTEKSREGNDRLSENPLATMYIKLDAMCRRNLTALGMNMDRLVESAGANSGQDPLFTLMAKVK